jgi:hypothetical protein
MKRIFSLAMIVAIVSLAVISCKDDFNEEDFLKLQSELKLKQDSVTRARDKALVDSTSKEAVTSYMNALNESGDLMAMTVLIRDNDVPVDGVTVRLVSGTPQSSTGGRVQAEQVATTDASGNVTFDRVTIGQGSISIVKTGYTPATALIDICCVGQPQPIQVNVNGVTRTHYTVPAKQFSNLLLPMYSKTGANTATITGKVTIETDVTNRTAEIPQNLIIRANYSSITSPVTGTVGVNSYSFDDTNFASATVNNTTGEYTMTVPAPTAGFSINMVLPTLEANQKIAAAFVDGVAIATGPEYRNQMTTFGPNAPTYTAVPQIFGAKVVFPAPPSPGRGFSITTPTAVSRSLGTGTVTTLDNTTFDNVTYQMLSRGRGFSSSPTIVIENGGGTGVTATASLRGKITSATVSSGGSGYAASTQFDIIFTFTDLNGNAQFLAGPIDVQSTAGGAIPTGALTLPNLIGFSTNANNYFTTQNIQGFGVRVVANGGSVADAPMAGVTNATVTFTNDNEINSINISNGGSGYTSAPAFAFSGGGTPLVSPQFVVKAFRTQFDFSLNSTNTTPYRVLPEGFVFTFPANAVDGITVEGTAKVDRISSSFTGGTVNANFISEVMTDGTNILPINATQAFRTNRFSVFPPTLSISDRSRTQAVAFVNVSPTSGAVTSLEDPSTGTFGLDAPGTAYDNYNGFTIVPSALTAPGTGANVALALSSVVNTQVTTWSGVSTVLSGGSGYLDELNQIRVPFGGGISAKTVTTSVTVSAGQTSVFNYNYGSGVPKVNLAGNFR